jgi:hypothetical protein
MLCGALLGRLIIFGLDENHPVYGGLIAFVIGQLMYLAAVELVADAHASLQDLRSAVYSRLFDVVLILGFVAELLVELFIGGG